MEFKRVKQKLQKKINDRNKDFNVKNALQILISKQTLKTHIGDAYRYNVASL